LPPSPEDPRLTERRNPRTTRIDLAAPAEIVDLMLAEDRSVADAVSSQKAQIGRAIELAEASFRAGGRLIYVGAGTSGRLGVLDASECPPTFGTDPTMVIGVIAGGLEALTRSMEGAEDVAADGAAAIAKLKANANDFVVGIAASGTTPYVRGALERAIELGAHTAILACSVPPADLRKKVTVAIVPLTGPEVITGSTRLKAGTATKMVLNMLTTVAMIKWGKTYGNLMVDVQTGSEKLKDRAKRILGVVTGLDPTPAEALLKRAKWNVKAAIVMEKANLTLPQALKRLRRADNSIREALGEDIEPRLRELLGI
jgi:N-acetylmuramic acid 6-phosphate etherase